MRSSPTFSIRTSSGRRPDAPAGLDEDHFRPWIVEPRLRDAGFAVRARGYAFLFPGCVHGSRQALARMSRCWSAFAPSAAASSTGSSASLVIALAQDHPGRRPAARGAGRASIASGVSIVLNYVFLLAAGRVLERAVRLARSPARPARGRPDPGERLQMAVSREVSRHIASGDTGMPTRSPVGPCASLPSGRCRCRHCPRAGSTALAV